MGPQKKTSEGLNKKKTFPGGSYPTNIHKQRTSHDQFFSLHNNKSRMKPCQIYIYHYDTDIIKCVNVLPK